MIVIHNFFNCKLIFYNNLDLDKMTHDLKFKNNPAVQSLYAWFPDAFADESKYKFQTSKDIYVNLGSRPPLPKSNTGILNWLILIYINFTYTI